MTKWILLECFSGSPGRVIAVGSTPKSFVPLTNIVRNPLSLADAQAALRQACATGAPVARASDDGRRTVRAEPLLIAPRQAHAVRLWVGPAQEPVATADPMGAWYFDLTTNRSVRSDDLLDLYGVAGRPPAPPPPVTRVRRRSRRGAQAPASTAVLILPSVSFMPRTNCSSNGSSPPSTASIALRENQVVPLGTSRRSISRVPDSVGSRV